MIKGCGLGNEIELSSHKRVIKVIVVGAMPVVSAVTNKEALLLSNVLIDACGVVVILGDFSSAGILEVR